MMRSIFGVFLFVGVLAGPLPGQESGQSRFSIGPQAGVYLPVGDQADDLSGAWTLGAVVRRDLSDWMGMVGGLWWSATDAGLPAHSPRDEGIDLFQYDIGIELRPFASLDDGWPVVPFVGAGGGGRIYSFRDLDEDAQTDLAGFGSVGGEAAFHRLALRLEGRGYLSDFDGLAGEDPDSEGRGEFTFTAGLMYRF